eukprot:TRINITY_DN16580_c0_g1_i3.p1 TRINITY_DN16580_c0_g1~~TRINITY_DN16580_c0_g1_i3.p1  ORF type:complete len:581 (-),score=114.94 TRINITY_DN16580_c0_g1_i3:177-1919(-)
MFKMDEEKEGEGTHDDDYTDSYERDSSHSFSSSDVDQSTDLLAKYTKDYQLHVYPFSTTERMVPEVPEPAKNVLSDDEFFSEPGCPAITNIAVHLFNEGRIKKDHFIWLLEQVFVIFSGEENVVVVDAPVTVCGDIHGQYYDLIKLFEVGGDPATTNYLFLGDYVDRGNFSCEVIILMFSYKLLFPHQFFMLRGNHECRHLTEFFTFREECVYKYDLEVYDLVMDCFDALPLAAVMNRQFLCLHGGLSPELKKIDDIVEIDRFTEPPQSGKMCDILWADPMEKFGPDFNENFVLNNVRGCSYLFGFNAVCEFLGNNNLLSILRAHEAQDAGYCMHTKNEKTGFPSLITLFSAPNYLDTYGNRGAVLRYENNIINIRQFNESPHPYFLPGFINIFRWSLPFLLDKVVDFLKVVKVLIDDEAADRAEEAARKEFEERERKREALRNRIKALARILGMLNSLRENKNVRQTGSPFHKSDEISSASRRRTTPLRNSLGSFARIRTIDFSSEKRPEGVERVHERVLMEMSNPSSPTAIRKRKSHEILSNFRSTSPPSHWYGSTAGSPKLVESGFHFLRRDSVESM